VDDKKKRGKKPNFDEFQTWLAGLGLINPTLHVNGVAHPGAVLTVDFGTPLIEQKFEAEQSADLVTRMRAATRVLFQDKELNIRVQNDSANGIWWSSVG
jgi:hypothetical protein